MKNFLSELWKNWGGLYLGLAYHLVLTCISDTVEGKWSQLALVVFFVLVYVFAFAFWAPVEQETQRHIRKNLESVNAQLKQENERLAKRICELQSDLSKEKSLNEKMKRCSNCIHRFVRHFSQEGICQRPNCKNYSDWCFDGQFLEIEK